jgi:ATP/ADP translocase
MFIIQGALTAITIVGILIAWLPIWIGVLVLQSAGAIERAQLQGDAAALKESLAKLRTYFVIQGVLYLVGIVLMVIYFAFFASMLGVLLHNGFNR